MKGRTKLIALLALLAGGIAFVVGRRHYSQAESPLPPSTIAPTAPPADLRPLLQHRTIAGAEAAELRSFYQRRSYAPAWIDAGNVSDLAHQFLAAFRDAEAKGLKPEDYDASSWASRVEEVGQRPSGVEAARFDVALTASALRYLSDVCYGRANPGVYTKLAKRNKRSLAQLLETVRAAPAIAPAIDQLEPQFDEYHGLLRALPRYRALAAQETEKSLTIPKKTVEPGAEYADLPRLRRLLHATGDLSGEVPTPADGQRYDGALVDAVKCFQDRHGLLADGRLGRETFEALNTPFAARVRQIELALERWRWIPREVTPPLIVINVPELELRVFDESYRALLPMRIIAGQHPGHETPLFAGGLEYVIFHPYWNVPASIQQKELVPHLEKDRSYLLKNDYELMNAQGEKVDAAMSDQVLAQLKSGRLALRQVPGPKNALGRVKFVFPNENNVYLHDTPSKSLFRRSQRFLSHGCIRIEKPFELAVWLLRDNPLWPEDRVAKAMEGSQTQQVNLRARVPVIIVYQTATVHADGQVRFFRDFYKQDAKLSGLVESRRPSPGAL